MELVSKLLWKFILVLCDVDMRKGEVIEKTAADLSEGVST